MLHLEKNTLSEYTIEAEDSRMFRVYEKARDCYRYERENEYEKYECVSI